MIKVAIIGTRGIPAKYGGFETFAAEIAPRLVNSGYEISVQCDPGTDDPDSISGVKLYFSRVTKSKHPLLYYYEGLRWAFRNADIVLVVTTFGSIFYPLKYFYRKPVITNTDGIESRRAKWSPLHKAYIRFSEFLAVQFSDCLIADSEAIARYLITKYKSGRVKVQTIVYGAPVINSLPVDSISRYNLDPLGYYIVICRIEPENNIEMIIEGFCMSGSSKKLVIIGDTAISNYSARLYEKFKNVKNLVFPGSIYNKEIVNGLRFWSFAYLHGHSVGGTNPSLLESMGCGNITVCHDNEFNREVTDNRQYYFKSGTGVSEIIRELENLNDDRKGVLKTLNRTRVAEFYDWDKVAEQYALLVKRMLNP